MVFFLISLKGMGLQLKKYEIIKKNSDFNEIINTGLVLKNHYYNIYYKDRNESLKENIDDNLPKFGLAVSKKCGNAVERNKIKRRLRMIIDNNKKMFKKRTNYIIMVKKDIVLITYQEMNDSLVKLMKGHIDEKI